MTDAQYYTWVEPYYPTEKDIKRILLELALKELK